jgi:hypothetical protein
VFRDFFFRQYFQVCGIQGSDRVVTYEDSFALGCDAESLDIT